MNKIKIITPVVNLHLHYPRPGKDFLTKNIKLLHYPRLDIKTNLTISRKMTVVHRSVQVQGHLVNTTTHQYLQSKVTIHMNKWVLNKIYHRTIISSHHSQWVFKAKQWVFRSQMSNDVLLCSSFYLMLLLPFNHGKFMPILTNPLILLIIYIFFHSTNRIINNPPKNVKNRKQHDPAFFPYFWENLNYEGKANWNMPIY